MNLNDDDGNGAARSSTRTNHFLAKALTLANVVPNRTFAISHRLCILASQLSAKGNYVQVGRPLRFAN